MQANLKKNGKYYNIEAIRFLFSVLIIYYHIFHSNIMNFTGGSAFYSRLKESSDYAGIIVECFFILSGFFLYYSYCKNPSKSAGQFVFDKFSRLWPVFFVATVAETFFYEAEIYPLFLNLLFLQSIGISPIVRGINWYVSSLFWVLIFYFVLLKYTKNKKKLNIFIGVIVYFSYMILLSAFNGGFGREVVYGVFSGALLRALAGVGLGYLIAVCAENVRNMPSVRNFKPSAVQNILITAVISLCELAFFALLLVHFLYKEKAYEKQFIVVILYSGLLLCMLTEKGILSRLCNNKIIGSLGKYTYSIYIMQQTSFYILQRTLWKNTDFVQNHALRCIAVSVLFSVVLGIAVYYIIEKPSARLLKKFGRRLFAKEARY